jgi:hypothetical protein
MLTNTLITSSTQVIATAAGNGRSDLWRRHQKLLQYDRQRKVDKLPKKALSRGIKSTPFAEANMNITQNPSGFLSCSNTGFGHKKVLKPDASGHDRHNSMQKHHIMESGERQPWIFAETCHAEALRMEPLQLTQNDILSPP